MAAQDLLHTGPAEETSQRRQVAVAAETTNSLPRFVRAEANLLRLPLFALHTKGLKTLDGIECRGTMTRDGQRHDYVFRATRNTATLYPGPLARAAHLALLSIATERGLPLANPIPWKWRDLIRRIGVTPCGQMVQHLKAAIQSTAMLGIHSEYAVYAKPEGRLIRTQKEALHLYERVTFVGCPLPDGTVADANYLWLAAWYLDNLNAMFTAPIDYDLWRALNQASPIASRLYEFLLLNFYSGTPVLRINYENLVQLLPVRPESYRSQAIQQLGPALRLLTEAKIIRRADWGESKRSIAQLHLYRGDRMALPVHPAHGLLGLSEEESSGSVQVTELRNLKSPEWSLVADFYHLWAEDGNRRPSAKELEHARHIIEANGLTKAKALLPFVVKRLKEQWPDAKTFGAVSKYLPEVAEEYERRERSRAKLQGEEARRKEEQANAVRKEEETQRLLAEWTPVWESLTPTEQEEIRQAVARGDRHLPRQTSLFHRFCLKELARRRAEARPQAQAQPQPHP